MKVDSVIGFHEGTYDLYYKLQSVHSTPEYQTYRNSDPSPSHREVKQALEAGAEELDLVINWEDLQAGEYAAIYSELASIRWQAPPPITLKLILETSQLNDPQIVAACTLAAAANFDFVKTSTGFNGHGATIEHVRLMAACCEKLATDGKKMQVKASGGIRTMEDAVGMLEAGASRLGTSAGVWIAKEAKETIERRQNSTGSGDEREQRPGLATRLFSDY